MCFTAIPGNKLGRRQTGYEPIQYTHTHTKNYCAENTTQEQKRKFSCTYDVYEFTYTWRFFRLLFFFKGLFALASCPIIIPGIGQGGNTHHGGT